MQQMIELSWEYPLLCVKGCPKRRKTTEVWRENTTPMLKATAMSKNYCARRNPTPSIIVNKPSTALHLHCKLDYYTVS